MTAESSSRGGCVASPREPIEPQNMTNSLTVLLATFRRPEILRRTLEGYLRLEDPGVAWSLLVVDNADDVDTRAVVAACTSAIPVRYLCEPRTGKNHALNRGLEEATGELFVFTDDDAIPQADWLRELLEGSERWPEATVFGGRVRPVWPDGRPGVALRTDILRSAFAAADWGDNEGPISPDKVWGPNMAVRSHVFRDGMQFDPSIGPAGSDYAMGSELELSRRLAEKGCGAVYLPGAVVGHQIRPEQMEEGWLARRAYRSGRGVARLDGLPKAVTVLGVPRFVFRELAVAAGQWLSGLVTGDGERRLDGKLNFWHWRGKLTEYRRLSMEEGGEA